MRRIPTIAAASILVLAGGCQMFTPSSDPSYAEKRQSSALADPMNYSIGPPKSVSQGSPMDDLDDIFNK